MRMNCNKTFSSQAGEEKQIYFAHNLCSKNRKCTGIQNCEALKNVGFTPPPYYLKSSSTDIFDWDERKIGKNVAQYYKNREKKIKVNKSKPDMLENKTHKGKTGESIDLDAYNNIHVPKNVYMYKRKHLVQEITYPRRIKTSLTNLYRSHKKKTEVITSNKKEKLKNKDMENKKYQNLCKCPETKGKKKKVEFEILPNPEKDLKDVDRKIRNPVCNCETPQKVKKAKSNKCGCKDDKVGDSVPKNKKQKFKHKHTKEKDKITSFYHEFMKKIHFDDVPPEGNEVHNYIFDSYDGKIKNESLLDDRCRQGPCAKAAKKNNYEFVCKCIEKKKKPQEAECVNAICNITSTSTVAKIRKKIILLCDKYSHILKQKMNIPYEEKKSNNEICDLGLCRIAFDNKKDKFICKCVKKSKECTDASCGIETNWKSYLKTYYKFLIKSHKDKINNQNSSKRNAFDQTGEPFFELKVDSIGLYALNPKEIRTKVEELGKSQKQINCICPSRNRAKMQFLQKAACSAGICEKKFKDKKTNFKCKCLTNQGRICTDSTCEPDKKNISWSMDNNNPILEVKFSAKDMSILNTEEIRNNINDIKNKLQSVCSAGVCKEASKDKGKKYVCKCTKKKIHSDIEECGDNNCKNHSTWGRRVKSKISCLCARKSGMTVENKLKENKPTCDEHCKGNPETYTCCKCMNSRHKYVCRRSSKTRPKNNIHKRKGFSIPSIVSNKKEDSNTLLKCTKILTNSYSVLHKKVESRRHKFKRNGINIPLTNKDVNKIGNKKVNTRGDEACTCCLCGKVCKDCKCKHDSETAEDQSFGHPLSAIKNRYRQLVKYSSKGAIAIALTKYPKQKRVLHSDTSPKIINKTGKTQQHPLDQHKNVRGKICMCYHACECGLMLKKEKIKKQKMKKKYASVSRSERLKQMKNKRKKSKSHTQDAIKRRKEYLKEQENFRKELKKKEKADKKNKEKLLKIEKKELEAISKGREAEDTSCFADFCLGILKFFVFTIKWVFIILFKIIFDPKGSCAYIRIKLLDPVGTFERISKTISDAWRITKLKMLKSISGSDKMTILADTLQDTVIYQAFADKGKTPKEKRIVAQKNKQRKLRMEQRNTQAFRSCKHNLLHTLRKTPCLWVYHICPFFYPQCLGLLALMKQLTEILLFMLAFIVWTPCIACCETCRAFCCCILCTN